MISKLMFVKNKINRFFSWLLLGDDYEYESILNGKFVYDKNYDILIGKLLDDIDENFDSYYFTNNEYNSYDDRNPIIGLRITSKNNTFNDVILHTPSKSISGYGAILNSDYKVDDDSRVTYGFNVRANYNVFRVPSLKNKLRIRSLKEKVYNTNFMKEVEFKFSKLMEKTENE